MPALDDYNTAPAAGLLRLQWHAYYQILRVLPATVRQWWSDRTDRQLRLAVEKYVYANLAQHPHPASLAAFISGIHQLHSSPAFFSSVSGLSFGLTFPPPT